MSRRPMPMPRLRLFRSLSTASVLLAAACSTGAPADPVPRPAETANTADAYRHPRSGMIFPAAVAGFARTRIAHFQPGDADAAVAYDYAGPSGEIAATVYVRPAPDLLTLGMSQEAVAAQRTQICRTDFLRARDDMLAAHLQPSPARQHPVTLDRDGVPARGLVASSTYIAGVAGVRQPIRTDLYMFCFAAPGWTLEFRFSYPQDTDAEPRVAAFLGALEWTGLRSGR